jgi:hypothetical protein
MHILIGLGLVSRHRSVDTLHVRRADLFRGHAGAAFL